MADNPKAAGDINMNSANGHIHISFINSSTSYIYTYDPSSDTFLDTYVTPIGVLVYGIAASGDNLYLSITAFSKLTLKTFNLNASSDPDSTFTLTKVAQTLTISSDFSLIDSSKSIVGSAYPPCVSNASPPTPIAKPRSMTATYDSTDVWNITVVVPVPAPAPIPQPAPVLPPSSSSNSNVSTSLESPTAATQTMSYTMAGTTPITMTFNAVTMMTASGSFQNFWSLINEYQLYETLVIMGVYIPDQLVQFWITVQPSIFSFSFMNKVFPNPMVAFDSFKSDQTNDAYTKIGIKYQSLLANKIFFLINIAVILLVDMILTPILIWLKRRYTDYRKRFAEWLLSFFHFKIYIRSLIESFLFTMIWGFDEINQYFNNYPESGKNPTSFIITMIWVILMNIFTLFVCWHYFKTSWKINEDPLDKFTSEMYLEVKKTRRGRSYTFVFFLRRLAISTIVVFSVGRMSFTYIIWIFSLIQFLTITYSVVFRPMANVSTNFIEIMNNMIFWMVSTSLVYFNSKEKWINAATYAIMGLLVMSSIVVCIIAFIDLIRWIIHHFKNKNKSNAQVNIEKEVNKRKNSINSSITQANLNEYSQSDQSQNRFNFDRQIYPSTEIASNHMYEEVKSKFCANCMNIVSINNQQLIRQNYYNDLSRIKSEILAVMK